MKTTTGILLAAAVGTAVLSGPAQAQDGGSVTIHRGAQVETVRFETRGGVTVVRGQPAEKAAAPHRRQDWRRAGRHKTGRAVAGDTLWLVDKRNDRLVACELRSTTQVGGRRIRCIDRALPIAWR